MAATIASMGITPFRGAVAPAGVGAPADREVRRWRLSLTVPDARSGVASGLQQEVVDRAREVRELCASARRAARQSASSALRYAICSTSDAKTTASTEANQRVARGATSRPAVKSVANHIERQ